MRTADVRFYFDADILGLGRIVARLRHDTTFPGDPGGTIKRRTRPPCPIPDPATPDSVWIPTVARLGWLIVTRDRSIRDHRAELDAVRINEARMVALAGAEAGDTWAQLEVVMTQWRRIEGLLAEAGPFIYTATRTALTRVDLGS